MAYERLEAALFAEQRATDAELAQKEAEAAGGQEREMNNRWVIDTSGGQLAAAIERAERAEGERIALLENLLISLGIDPGDVPTELMEAAVKTVIAGILARLSELEAAQQWRPETDAS